MEHTHTFEIQLNGNTIEGEIFFDGEVHVKYNTAPDLSLGQMERINMLFRAVGQLCKLENEKVSKIEIVCK